MHANLREQIFISYSHADKEWLELFKRHLKPIPQNRFVIWSDTDIQAGSSWKAEIDEKLSAATMALLLVSDHFLDSDFIRDVELPAILNAATTRGLKIYWVPLTTTTVNWTPLRDFQACASPDKPLDLLSSAERNKVVVDICGQIYRHCDQLVRTSAEHRDRLKGQVRAVVPAHINLEIGEVIGGGDYSIVYQGTLDEREVAIKVLVDSPLREREEIFKEAAKRSEDYQHPCFIRVRDAFLDAQPQCLVMDYIDAPTLAQKLACDGAFSCDRVVDLIHDLAEALTEYHQSDSFYGALRPDDVFIDATPRLRLSPLGISSHLAQSDHLSGYFPTDRKSATYLGPEQYLGYSLSDKSDQYALGLLAFQMLEGKVLEDIPGLRITCPADFPNKLAFFDDARAFAGDWKQRHPALAAVIFKMLSRNAEDRWPRLVDLVEVLAGLDSEAVAIAKQHYKNHCRGNGEFYKVFYDRFFERCPGAARMFSDMTAQYRKLDDALNYLLNFRPASLFDPVNSLSPTHDRHREKNVSETDFDLFISALLDTLRERTQADETVITAWQTAVAAGVEYLKQGCGHRRAA